MPGAARAAAASAGTPGGSISVARWTTEADDRRTWPLDRYLDEGPRTIDWLTKNVVKYHRTVGTYLNTLLHAGFAIAHVEEWGPSAEQVAGQPDWADEQQRPAFLIIAATRP